MYVSMTSITSWSMIYKMEQELQFEVRYTKWSKIYMMVLDFQVGVWFRRWSRIYRLG